MKYKILISIFISSFIFSQKILIPMDNTQKDHLKAYGVAFHSLQKKSNVEWLLNYRGGSFLFDNQNLIAVLFALTTLLKYQLY